jgi:hypothetical protein
MALAAANDARHSDTTADVVSGLAPADEAGRDVSDTELSPSLNVSPTFTGSRDSSASTSTPTSTIISPESTVAPPSSDLLDLKSRQQHDVMATLEKRDGRSPGRRMDDEAIAGTAVGVVLAFALLVCCIYPVVVHYVKKRRRAKQLSFECEYGNYRGQPPVLHRRLSSSDSLKNGEPSKERGCPVEDPYAAFAHAQGQTRQPASGNTPGTNHDGSAPDAIEPAMAQGYNYYSSYPFYYQDVIPASAGPQQIVLKGTSEDYYSPHIPSEAFGMFPTPGDNVPTEPGRSVLKHGSLRYNVRSLFRRREVGDQPTTAPAPYSDQPTQQQQQQHGLQDPSQVQQFYSAYETTQAPTQFAPMAMELPYAMPHGFAPMPTMPHEYHQQVNGSTSTDPSAEFTFPFQPSNVTVNPMDIMPASTESEMWHRTDFQLFSTAYDESPDGRSNSAEMPPDMDFGGAPLPPMMAPPPPPAAQESAYTSAPNSEPLTPVPSKMMSQPEAIVKIEGSSSRAEKRPHSAIPSMSAPPRPIHPAPAPPASSTSIPGSSSKPSTMSSTPSAHDSPSPESLHSSDYGHHSASPHDGVNIPSPRGGVYSCDEPGCNQVFDQPHKLKHHQRYHSKDHKCPYASCGKGFGTKTHLQRHINDRHEKKKKFHCSMQGCDYSRSGGKAFPRKDNWKRHMTKIHGLDHRSLPEPVEVDSDMAGA